MGAPLGTPGAPYKNQSQAPLRLHASQADGRQTLSRVQVLGNSGLWSGQLATDSCKAVPQSTGHLNGA